LLSTSAARHAPTLSDYGLDGGEGDEAGCQRVMPGDGWLLAEIECRDYRHLPGYPDHSYMCA